MKKRSCLHFHWRQPLFMNRIYDFAFISIIDELRSFLYLQTNANYAFGGVPSAFDTIASIWIRASSGKADTPTVLRAGTPPGKNVL